MNELELYHNLYSTKDILCKYPAAKSHVKEMESLLEKITSKVYRVAVLGEFKRGKSSLVNTLLGTEILPTDIIPTTAVVNRIIYDNEQKIVINYKDGKKKETSIEALGKYATKLDEQSEITASLVNDITVHYPSVFGQNNIEIIDTPGLNDDDAMTKKTLEIIDKVDTAIVVISATMPLSITEQNLIHSLIEQSGIFHLTFVVTFIDRVSEEKIEQDRVVEEIRERIKGKTYELFVKKHSDNAELIKKAEDILKEPDVFAVSSKLAMKGFIMNKMSMIEESRFPHFKTQLLALLTGNRKLDIQQNAQRLLNTCRSEFPLWRKSRLTAMQNEMKKIEDKITLLKKYVNEENLIFKQEISQLAQELVDAGCPVGEKNIDEVVSLVNYRKYFIKNLSDICRKDYSEKIVKNAIIKSLEETTASAGKLTAEINEILNTRKNEIFDEILEKDKMFEIDSAALYDFNIELPKLKLEYETVTENISDYMGNIFPIIAEKCLDLCQGYVTDVSNYLKALIMHLKEYERNAVENVEKIIKTHETILENNREAEEKLRYEMEMDSEEIMKLTE